MNTTDNNSEYSAMWDRYWGGTPDTIGDALWDCEPDYAAAQDLVHCRDAFDHALPLVDLGCGNGTQTRFLAGHFPRVIGLDVSREGVEMARRINAAPSLTYDVLDALDAAAVRSFRDAHGDVNVYMRTVLHQMAASDRAPLVAAVSALCGARGRAFVYELAPSAHAFFESLAQRFGAPPPKLAKVFECGIVPAELADGEAVGMFGEHGMRVTKRGDSHIHSTQQIPGGERLRIPAEFWVFERAT